MIKGIFLDLDMCVFDTRSLGKNILDPVNKIIYSSDLPEGLKKKIERQLWTTSIDDVIDLFTIPENLGNKMKEAYINLEVPAKIKTFGDEGYLKDIKIKKILVTSGFSKFQQAKIDKLKISHLFDQIIIDAIDNLDKRKGKTKIFQDILRNNQWNNNEVIVIGDNPNSELGAAKKLGIPTIQILRPTIEKWHGADHYITSLRELGKYIS